MDVDTAETESSKKGKQEASFERLPNLSRVVPAQIPHISFPSECRFVPIRSMGSTVTTTSRAAKGKAGVSVGSGSAAAAVLATASTGPSAVGSGIVVLQDKEPGKEGVEYYEVEATKDTTAPTATANPTSAMAADQSDTLAVDMNVPIADPRKSLVATLTDLG